MPKWSHTLQSSRLLDFHMQHIFNIAKGDSKLMEAMYLLESAIDMVKHQEGFTVVEFHLRRVEALGKGQRELDLHLGFLMECVYAIHENI